MNTGTEIKGQESLVPEPVRHATALLQHSGTASPVHGEGLLTRDGTRRKAFPVNRNQPLGSIKQGTGGRYTECGMGAGAGDCEVAFAVCF